MVLNQFLTGGPRLCFVLGMSNKTEKPTWIGKWLNRFDSTNRVVWMIGDIVTNWDGKKKRNVYIQQEFIDMLSTTGFRLRLRP